MMGTQPIELTHSTHKEEDGRPVKVLTYPHQIFAVMNLPTQGATGVLSIAGAFVTVLESVDEVNQMLVNTDEEKRKGSINE